MSENLTKKQLQEQYKEREVTGGVYAIRNKVNGKLLVDVTPDMGGMRNRFDFAQKAGSCIFLKLRDDWNQLGAEQFDFEVLETLTKGQEQSPKEFKDDLGLLKHIWLEKLGDSNFY